jgi:hypothetical protein
MKLLALVMLLAVVQTAPPVPRQATNAPSRSSQQSADQGNGNKNPTATTPVKDAPYPDSEQGKNGVKQTDNKERTVTVSKLPTVSVGKDRWDIVYFFLTAALVVVGAGTWWVIWIQAKETAKAAKSTKESAAATRQSAAATESNTQAFREAERAWIIEEIRFPDHIPTETEMKGGILSVGFVFKNVGKQPAFVRIVQSRFFATNERLPDKPLYSLRHTSVFTSRLLVPGEPLGWECFFEEGSLANDQIARINGLQSPPLHLYVYGRIEYESVGITGSNQFCYKWHNLRGVSFEGDKTEFRKYEIAPDEYNKHT